MERKRMGFSIVVPTYNRPEQLRACLQALADLDYPKDRFEVIVVDDGSKSPPDRVVASFHHSLNVILIAQQHAGPADARNTGAGKAKGTFLAFTDDDCRPAHDWLTRLEKHLADDPACLLGGRTINAIHDSSYSIVSQLLIDYLYAYYNADPEHARFLASNNLALSAERFYAVGGFDHTYPCAAGEDREFCDRWLAQGHRIVYATDAVVHHAHRLTLRTLARQHFWYGRGAFRFRRAQARRRGDRIRVEPRQFYRDLLRYPASRIRGLKAAWLSLLLVLTQAAHIAGFFYERRCSRTKN
jgi:glycosyltransferase involved in cell wall biosynthesis